MKKFIFTLVIAIATSFVFVSCTEEEIAPNTHGHGEHPIDPVKK